MSRPESSADFGTTKKVASGTHYPRGVIVLAVARPVLTVAALIAAYYLLPVDRQLTGWTLVALVGGLCLVVVIIVWEFRLIIHSRYPALQGINALALTIPLYLLIFANVDYLMAHSVAGSFNVPMTRSDALYFGVTVFATVGFGDIVPVSHTARLLVTGQMVGNLLLIGVALRVLLTAVQQARRNKEGNP